MPTRTHMHERLGVVLVKILPHLKVFMLQLTQIQKAYGIWPDSWSIQSKMEMI